ncbi:hypothetical protein [Azospirillum argentinense]|uniref:hypothetical protein n=1 Tax=Azospirillum argentinense TaxID=2970906 RepID=UPI0032DE9702
MSGFYLMHRGWQDNPAFNNEPFSRRDAWVWLIETANYAEGRWSAGGRTIVLKRGQLCRPLRKIAEAWQWDEAKVRRFLSRLKADAMILCETDAKMTLISICNYDEYQSLADDERRKDDATATHHRRNGDAHKKEGNENKEGEESRALPGDALPDLAEQGVVTPPANDNPHEPAKQTKRGTRVPDGDLPEEWAIAANHAREKHNMPLLTKRVLDLRWASFQDYWRGVTGERGLKADWLATWRNNCRDSRTERKFPPDASGQGPSGKPNRQLLDMLSSNDKY